MAEERIDLLDRQPFIDKLLGITVALSDRRQNICFAVDGEWGIGKSFVLDMMQDQMQEMGREGEELTRFLVFRYNCWEYDFYEEPLIAIVAAMLDELDKKTSLLPEKIRSSIRKILCTAGSGFALLAGQVLKETIRIDALGLFTGIIKKKTALEEAEREKKAFDQYRSFMKELEQLRNEIAKIAEEQTVIFLVDELDRCFPEYAIKVLERLHHLTEGIPNVQVLLSVDMGQLDHTIRQIYGEKTNTEKYLRKFLDFKIKLPVGSVQDSFDIRFDRYVQQFKAEGIVAKETEICNFKKMILDEINMRHLISIIEKCELLHELLCDGNATYLYPEYMCLELFLAVLDYTGPDLEMAKSWFNIKAVFQSQTLWLEKERKAVPKGLGDLSDIYSKCKSPKGLLSFSKEDNVSFVDTSCLLGLLLKVYRRLLGFKDYETFSGVQHVDENEWSTETFEEYGVKFWDLLQLMQ